MKLTSRHYAWLAAALFAIEIAIEGAHVATRTPWISFTATGGLALSLFWSSIWLLAAAGMILHRQWGAAFGVAGAIGSLMHGLVIVVAGSEIGLVFFAVGLVLVFLMKRASPWFGWGTLSDPAHAAP